MSRVRLTDKTASEMGPKATDPNMLAREPGRDPGAAKYETGTPSDFAEDVDTKGLKNLPNEHTRNEMGLPKDQVMPREASEAIRRAAVLEAKAAKCIIASHRMLPTASDRVIEANATDLMFAPTAAIDRILARQERLASDLESAAQGAAGDLDEDKATEACKTAEEEQTEQTEQEVKPEVVNAEEDKFAALMGAVTAMQEQLAALTAAKGDTVEPVGDEDGEGTDETVAPVEAPEAADENDLDEDNDVEPDDDETAPAAPAAPAARMASAKGGDLLDSIFSTVTASKSKSGAKKLSGLVSKQASAKEDGLSALWGGAPDVSAAFR